MEIAGSVSVILAQKGSAVWSIAPTSTVYDAIHFVENDRLIGIISERDYTRKVVLKGKLSKETMVKDIMTKDPLTAHPGDSIAECMEVMTENRIRHLPVTEGDKIVGLVSLGDLVRRIISAQSAAIHTLQSYITGSYPV